MTAAAAAFPAFVACAVASHAEEACQRRMAGFAGVEADGSIRLKDGRLVQLSGIEAPDSADGMAAFRARAQALAGDKELSLGGEGQPDRYNRIHAMVFMSDGMSLQWKMVAEGLGRVRFLPGETLCGEKMLEAEDVARRGGLGLWGSHEYAIWRADDPSLLGQIGLYALVEGRVVSVGAGSPIVFLDFGQNWRRDFTVMVAASGASRFDAAGKKLESLANRVIRVRGVIEASSGPAMRIENPDAIEVLDGD